MTEKSIQFFFFISAFHKTVKIGGQEYALQLIDTAGQVSIGMQ